MRQAWARNRSKDAKNSASAQYCKKRHFPLVRVGVVQSPNGKSGYDRTIKQKIRLTIWEYLEWSLFYPSVAKEVSAVGGESSSLFPSRKFQLPLCSSYVLAPFDGPQFCIPYMVKRLIILFK